MGHTLLCQHHSAPTAAESSINRRMDLLDCCVSWCFGIAGVLQLVWGTASGGRCRETERGEQGSEEQEPRGKMGRSRVFGLERRQRIGTGFCSVWKTAVRGEI